jgi:hypothetical protein
MRVEEITLLRWVDLNERDRTITIRNRKHPRQKQGNDQEVPLFVKVGRMCQGLATIKVIHQHMLTVSHRPSRVADTTIACPPTDPKRAEESNSLPICEAGNEGERHDPECFVKKDASIPLNRSK